MNSESFLKGLPLSSTPIQSLQDSGYYESSQEKKLCRSNVKFINSYSPIKEYTFLKCPPKDLSLEYDSGFESCESRINLLEYVNFTQSDLSSEQEHCEVSKPENDSHDTDCKNKVCTLVLSNTQGDSNASDFHTVDFFVNSSSQSFVETNRTKHDIFSICETKELDALKVNDFKCLVNSSATSTASSVKYINTLNVQIYNTKLIKLDFIHELRNMNCTSIISSILSYLSAEEICRASCVSKEWRSVIVEDKAANCRRTKLIEERTLLLTGPSKENHLGTKSGPQRGHKMAFSDLTNKNNSTGNIPECNKSSKSRFDSFIREAKNGHRLLKCPKCSFASKCDIRNNYICTHCSYNFCGDCLSPIFKNHTCYTFGLPKTFIDSKKSKKNLRRL